MIGESLWTLGQYVVVDSSKKEGDADVHLGYLYDSPERVPVYLRSFISEQKCDPKLLLQYRREAKRASRFAHAALAKFNELAVVDGQCYVVTEAVQGVALSQILEDVIASQSRLDVGTTFAIAEQMAAALDYMNTFIDPETNAPSEAVHANLNPRNIMIDFSGHVKLTNFCLYSTYREATPSTVEQAFASIFYYSPVRTRSGRESAGDDIFAFGLILWELLTGTRYYNGLSRKEIMAALRDFHPRDPREVRQDLNDELVRISMKCLNSEGFDGYLNMTDVFQDLQSARAKVSPVGSEALKNFVSEKYASLLATSQQSREAHTLALATYKPPAVEPVSNPVRSPSTAELAAIVAAGGAPEGIKSESLTRGEEAPKSEKIKSDSILSAKMKQSPAREAQAHPAEDVPAEDEIQIYTSPKSSRPKFNFDFDLGRWAKAALFFAAIFGAYRFGSSGQGFDLEKAKKSVESSLQHKESRGEKQALSLEDAGSAARPAQADGAASAQPAAVAATSAPLEPEPGVRYSKPAVYLPGERHLAASAAGGASAAATAGASTAALKPAQPDVPMSYVAIHTNPEGAKVWIDRTLAKEVRPGMYAFPTSRSVSLIVEKKPYRPFSMIMDGSTTQVEIDLRTGNHETHIGP